MNKNIDEYNDQLDNVEDKLKNNPVYQKMLNNLLGISNRDNAVCASSKTDNFDLKQLLSASAFSKIFTQKTFTVKIENKKDYQLIEKLSDIDNFYDFVETAEENGLFISIADRKLLEKDFDAKKDEQIQKLSKKEAQFIAKWKKIRNKYLDKQAQVNSWPLYVGTMFIEAKTNRTSVYGPLLLKKVQINITNRNEVEIQSLDDSVEVNEKLLFLLKDEFRFNLPKLLDDNSTSFEDITREFEDALSPIIKNGFKFNEKWLPKNKADIKTVVPQFVGGCALMQISPSGGALRNQMLKMIENDWIKDTLEVDNLKNLFAEVEKELIDQKQIYRITPTDASQERAIFAAAKDSVIIWGPPGTGKSQTISNIIANFLVDDKRVIITSEKKAALDVLMERVGKLRKWIFFGLTDKNMNKKEFYVPFQEMMEAVRKATVRNLQGSPKPLISSNEKQYFQNGQFLKNENTDHLLTVHKYVSKPLGRQMFDEGYDYLHLIKEQNKLSLDAIENQSVEKAFQLNGINKTGFWIFKNYPSEFKRLRKGLEHFKLDQPFITAICGIKDLSNIDLTKKYINDEKEFSKTKGEFSNDENYIDYLMAKKFGQKLDEMKNPNHELSSETKSFMKACDSGHRLPFKFIDKYRRVIDELFSIFVSTPNTLATIVSFEELYDYAIFDEASQLHSEKAIPFLGIAERSIIAGDGQQMRPSNFFGMRDNQEQEDEQDEDALSLLDFAYQKGLKAREFMLTKNYRSNTAELMQFSSRHFYEGKLDVADNKKFTGHESIEVYDVKGKWEGRVNAKEAEALLECALSNLNGQFYKKVILLTFNSNQKQYIEALIYKEEEYSPIRDALESGEIVLRNLENIQGDEADLVIVSVAYDKNTSLGATYVARPEGKNALNVAISRAKSKMIVFKSISSDEVPLGNSKNESILVFKNWISYLESSSEERKEYGIETYKKAENFDSNFEIEVYDFLEQNLKLTRQTYMETQFNIGAYRIDIAIIDSKTNQFILGIEVDGYKYHSGFEKMTKDIERQRFIESKGYPIYRITELNWKINPDNVLKEIAKLMVK